MKIPGTTYRKSVSAKGYSEAKDMNLVCEGGGSVVARPQRSDECSDRSTTKKRKDEKISEFHGATRRSGFWVTEGGEVAVGGPRREG